MGRLVFAAVVGTFVASLTLVPLACTASDPTTTEPDTDGDGLSDRVETEIYGTSPVLKDTDGDGWTDREEIIDHAFDPSINPYLFNPRLADIPQVEVVFTSPPLVVVHLTDANGVVQSFTTTNTEGWTTTDTNGQSETDLQAQSLSQTHTIGSGVTVALGVSTTTPLNAGAGGAADAGSSSDAAIDAEEEPDASSDASSEAGPDAGSDARADAASGGAAGGGGTMTQSDTTTESNTVTDSVSPSQTDSVAVTFSDTNALGYSEALAQAETWQQSRTITASSGEIKISTVLVNHGHVACKVISIELHAVALGPGVEWPIGNLTPDPPGFSNFVPFALGPGQESPLGFHRGLLSLDEVAAIAQDTSAVEVRLSTFELDDSHGVSFVFALDQIVTKTALILIDYGGKRPPDRFLVATNLDPAHPGVTLGQAFTDILRLPFEASSSELLRVHDVGPAASSAGSWTIEHDRNDGSQIAITSYAATLAPYDLGQIMLHAGDVLHLTYAGP